MGSTPEEGTGGIRQWEEKSKNNFLQVIQRATETDPANFDEARKMLLEGTKEKNIVYAGLEEVMSTATSEVLEVAESKDCDYRTAAYVLALTKLNDHYMVRGIDI